MKKNNNSMDKKLCANLLNKRAINLNVFSAQHSSMNKSCLALFKYKNKMKIG